MAPIPQWTDFIALAEMDGAENNDRGSFARDMLASMANYMEARFTTRDTRLLADLIMSEAVRAAVIGGIAAQAQAAADIKAAAEAVAAAVGE
jgi:hypothetical protein